MLQCCPHPWLLDFYQRDISPGVGLIDSIRSAFRHITPADEEAVAKAVLRDKLDRFQKSQTSSKDYHIGRFADRKEFIGEVLLAWAMSFHNPNRIPTHTQSNGKFYYPWSELYRALVNQLNDTIKLVIRIWGPKPAPKKRTVPKGGKVSALTPTSNVPTVAPVTVIDLTNHQGSNRDSEDVIIIDVDNDEPSSKRVKCGEVTQPEVLGDAMPTPVIVPPLELSNQLLECMWELFRSGTQPSAVIKDRIREIGLTPELR